MMSIGALFAYLLSIQAIGASSLQYSADPSLLITNGQDAAAGQFPFFASIVLKLPLLPEQMICGGSILNDRWILSAGQCEILYNRPLVGKIRVRVGQQNRSLDGEYVQGRDVSLVIIHRKLERGIIRKIREYDIALLKLSSPLTLNKRVQPVKLPEPKSTPKGKAVLIGLGAKSNIIPQFPSVLQYANVSIINKNSCKDAINSISVINKDRLGKKQICTGPLDSKITACIGDSGNPLVQKNKNQTIQIGILSWSALPCGQSGSPAVYTEVSTLVDWIKKRIAENR